MAIDVERWIRVKHKNPEIARQGRTFNILLLSFLLLMLIVLSVYFIYYYLIAEEEFSLNTILNFTMVLGLVSLSYVLSIRGKVLAAVWLFLICTLMATTSAILTRGETNAIILVYPIIVISAGLILGPKTSFFFALASIGLYFVADMYLHYNGAMLVPDQESMAMNNYLAVIASMLIVALVTWLFTRNLRNYVAELKRRDKEKEILLKEIHHRVKNNLQIISSLLSLQSDIVEDEEIKKAFKESVGRIKSMSLIHERLYSSRDLGKIHFKEYVDSLLSHIGQVQSNVWGEISIHNRVDDLEMDFETSLNLGLIINELVTNSMKHAFPDNKVEKPRIVVGFTRSRDQMVLSVSDNGKGIGEIDPAGSETLGLQLVHTLAEDMDSSVEVRSDKGTEFILRFNSGGR